MLKQLIKSLANNRRNKFSQVLAKFAKLFSDHHHNCLGDIYTSGEVDILRVLSEAKVPVKTIFDVGANIGNWSREAHKYFPEAQIHAFELIPAVYASLEKNTAQYRNKIKIYNFGISNENSSLEVKAFEDTGLTSIGNVEQIHHNVKFETVAVEIKHGGEFCKTAGIGHINFLKIDVEGAEFRVVDSLRELLQNHSIDIVQFEFSLANVFFKVYLKDFYEQFCPLGYKIGRIYRREVDFHDYNPHEEFIGHGNYIMVAEHRKDIFEALARGLLN